MVVVRCMSFFFFFNDTATTEIYTLSLPDALPISVAATPLDLPGRLPLNDRRCGEGVSKKDVAAPRATARAGGGTMALVRCVTEMGIGVDVHGLDYTLAAKRAVFDAIHHSSLGFARLVGATADEMIVHVTIETPRPEKVQVDEVVASLPHGRTHVTVVVGGLELLNEDGSDGTLIANAIITVSVDDGK